MNTKFIFTVVVLILFSGCATTTNNQKAAAKEKESSKEVSTALKSVAEAISQQELSEKDMRRLSTQIQKDKKTQTAIKSITETLEGKKAVTKYCPLDGKRYGAHLEFCPGTDVPLKIVE